MFTLDGYSYGRSNQMEQLAALLAYLDDTLLRRDYFIQFFVEAGPRYHYLRLLGLASHLLPLPVLFFVLTVAANTATLLISFRTALQLFGNLIAAYAALLLVGSLYFFVRLGDAGFVLTDYLSPSTLAIPALLGAISLALSGDRPGAAMLCAAGAAVVHPLYGLAAAGSAAFIAAQQLRYQPPSALRRRQLLLWGGRLLAFGAFFALLWYRPSAGPRLDDATYFHIYARTRGPHHVLPSTWPWQDWVLFAVFTLCSLIWLRAVRARLSALRPLLGLAALVMLGFVVGYVFVERLPVRAIMVAQAYRFICITTWVGILLAAGAIGSLFEAELAASERARRWLTVGLAFALLVLVERVVSQRFRGITPVLLLILALGAWAVHVGRYRRIAVSVLLAALAAFAVLRFGVFRERERWLSHRRPTFSLNDLATRYDDVAVYARTHTDRDAVFAIADAAKFWESGAFRYKAERALLVDHKVFPYGDPEIAEWYARTSALRALDLQRNNDLALSELARRWEVDYAILPHSTPTQLPVVFTGKQYQLVALRGRRDQRS